MISRVSSDRLRGRRALAVALLGWAALAGCSSCDGKSDRPGDPGKQATDGRSAAEGPESSTAAGATQRTLPPLADLHPVIQESGEDGVAPAAITVELSQPVVRSADVPVSSETVLKITPDVDGTLAWKSPSTLVFTPRGSLRPDTEYAVRLESLANEDGAVVKASGAEYQRVFRTPKLALSRASFSAFDPKKHRLEVELVFSAPVDLASVKEAAEWTVKDAAIAKVNYERTDRPNVVRATLFDARIAPAASVRYFQSAGVRYAADKTLKAPEAKEEIKLREGEPISIFASYIQEGTSGFYVTVVCRDEGSSKQTQWHWDNVINQSFQVSPRCVLDESDARESVHFNPPVKFSVSPARGGFRLLGNFSRGSYSMRIDANARSVDGGVLKKPYLASFSVPARKPQVSFVSQGRYLPPSVFKNLPIRHMNVSEVELTVRNVRLDNMIFWMSAEQETADQRNSHILLKKKIPLKGRPDQLTTSWLDVGSLAFKEPVKGIIELALTTEGASAKSRVLLTDMNLVAKFESGTKQVRVWALSMEENMPLPRAEVTQVSLSGRQIGQCTTDREGTCVIGPKDESDPDPSEPFALMAWRDDDVSYIKYSDLKLDISESMVHGRPFNAESPYTAAIYGDRGVYRPGETAHVVAIVRGRDDSAPQEGMPVEIKLIDPKKKVAKKLLRRTNVAGLVAGDLRFDDYADTGSYQIAIEAGKKKIGDYTFNVEEFVPERMKVVAKAEKPEALITELVSFDISAQYLFGGSATKSRVELTCELRPAVFSPKTNANYEYGIWRPEQKPPAPLAIGGANGQLGADGTAKVSCPSLTQRGGFAGTARLVAKAAVFEAGSGRTTQGETAIWIHPDTHYVGLSSETKKARAGQAFNVDGVVVDWKGGLDKEVKQVELELFRTEHQHDWLYDEQQGRWSYKHYSHRVSDGVIPPVAVKDGKFTVSITPGSDASGFVVHAKAGRAQTDLQIDGAEMDWWSWSNENGRDETPRPQRPAAIEISAPDSVKVGAKAKAIFDSPFKGRALLTIETDRLLSEEWIDVQAGKTEWSFMISEFAPNVYLSVLIAKDPRLDSKEAFLPSRAFGVTSVRIAPTEFIHPLKLEVPAEVRSNSKLDVKLDLGPLDEPAVVTVAAVDEGILSLTKFESPDPLGHIFERRALGVVTYETIGWNLMIPAGGTSKSDGGDAEAGGAGRVQPVKPVALWSGVVEVPRSGRTTVSFEVPQYRGSLRVMAVSAGKRKMGHASANVLVRDPLVLQTTLPRFLTAGDKVEVPVFVTNLSGRPQSVTVSLAAESLPVPGVAELDSARGDDVVEIQGPHRRSLELKNEANGTVVFRVRALQTIGAAKLMVRAQAGELLSHEELDVPFVPAAPKSREVQRIGLAEGTTQLKKYLSGWVKTTERSTFWVTSNPYGDSFDHLKYLLHYPYGCIEQTTSSTRPLLYLARLIENLDPGIVAKETIEAMVISGVNRILSMQTPAGGFGYWPGDQSPTPWGSAYATHLLLDAQKLRYPVPEERVKDALDWIQNELTNRYENASARDRHWYYWEDAEAYMHFVLATAGRGRRARIERLIEALKSKSKPDPQDAEKMYILKAAMQLSGDRRYEDDLKTPDVSPISNYRDNGWSFYSDRRRRGFTLSVFTDLFGNDPAGEKLANLVAEGLRAHDSSWYTTQELVWGVTGLGKRIGETASKYGPAVLRANGKVLKPAPVSPSSKSNDRSWSLARASEYERLEIELSKAEGKVYLILSTEGVKENATYKIGGEGLQIKRAYVDASGEPLNLGNGSLKLGAVVFAKLSLRNASGERIQNIAFVDRFPAGWEIENPRLGRGGASMDWIKKDELWPIDYMNLRDDRIELFGALEAGQTKQVVFALRAVTAGQFNMPPVEAEAMYYPDHWAREIGQRVVVTGPWNDIGD